MQPASVATKDSAVRSTCLPPCVIGSNDADQHTTVLGHGSKPHSVIVEALDDFAGAYVTDTSWSSGVISNDQ